MTHSLTFNCETLLEKSMNHPYLTIYICMEWPNEAVSGAVSGACSPRLGRSSSPPHGWPQTPPTLPRNGHRSLDKIVGNHSAIDSRRYRRYRRCRTCRTCRRYANLNHQSANSCLATVFSSEPLAFFPGEANLRPPSFDVLAQAHQKSWLLAAED